MTLYTVINQNGPIRARLSIQDAAREILQYDGGQYDIRPIDNGGFGLFGKTLNGRWTRWPECSFAADPDTAEAEILAAVVNRSNLEWGVYAAADSSVETDYLQMIVDADDADREGYELMLADWRAL